jgi:hypothetical protein
MDLVVDMDLDVEDKDLVEVDMDLAVLDKQLVVEDKDLVEVDMDLVEDKSLVGHKALEEDT